MNRLVALHRASDPREALYVNPVHVIAISRGLGPTKGRFARYAAMVTDDSDGFFLVMEEPEEVARKVNKILSEF